MVKSKISNKVVYEENNDINRNDIDLDEEANVYEVNIVKFHLRVSIILGKMNDDYEEENILFFNIYLLDKEDSVDKKIGIFEITLKDYEIFKVSEDIENYGNILWFTKIDENSLNMFSINYESDEFDEINDNIIALNYGKKIKNFNRISIGQENKDFADKLRENFTSDTDRHNWIQEFMKNANYDIVDNEGNGDCFFCVIRDAFVYSGIDISISTIRNLLAKEADSNLYLNYKEQYDMYLDTIAKDKKKLKALNKEFKILENESIKISDRKEKIRKMNNMDKIKKEHDKIKDEIKISEDLLQEFIFMSEVSSLEDFKKLILSSKFWADSWVISTVERILNIKCILMSSDAFEQGDKDNVIHCNQLNDEVLEKKGEFNPDFYIIMDYNGYHYQLIRYGRKGIFNFDEIPYDLKNLIVYKCLEGNSGPFNIIPEFAKMKKNKKVKKRDKYDIDLDNIYSSKTVFQIYNKSSDKIPGKGVGESIEESEVGKYSELNKIENWRRKLSHMWPVEIEIDGDSYLTIEHYLQANKFVNYPELYKQFSIESKSALSKSPEKAILMGTENSLLRDKKYKIDIDYNKKKNELLEIALRKKFIENRDFRILLKNTHDAKIMEYKRASKPRVMDEIMKLRKEL